MFSNFLNSADFYHASSETSHIFFNGFVSYIFIGLVSFIFFLY